MDDTEGQEEVEKVKNCRRGKGEGDYLFKLPLINCGRGAGLEGR